MSDKSADQSPFVKGSSSGDRLTKRELIAAMAMQGMLADPNCRPGVGPCADEYHLEQVGVWSVRYADALLAALAKAPK